MKANGLSKVKHASIDLCSVCLTLLLGSKARKLKCKWMYCTWVYSTWPPHNEPQFWQWLNHNSMLLDVPSFLWSKSWFHDFNCGLHYLNFTNFLENHTTKRTGHSIEYTSEILVYWILDRQNYQFIKINYILIHIACFFKPVTGIR